MYIRQIGRLVYRGLSGESGRESREDEFSMYFRRAILFYFFMIVVYPILVEKFASRLGYSIDIGVIGTSILLFGSVLYGMSTLTLLPEFENISDIKNQILGYIGFLCICGGSIILFTRDLRGQIFGDLGLSSGLEESLFVAATMSIALIFPFFIGAIFLFMLIVEQYEIQSSSENDN